MRLGEGSERGTGWKREKKRKKRQTRPERTQVEKGRDLGGRGVKVR